jgi:hypothetical protein
MLKADEKGVSSLSPLVSLRSLRQVLIKMTNLLTSRRAQVPTVSLGLVIALYCDLRLASDASPL